MDNGRLLNLILSGPGSFNREWIADGGKRVAPLTLHSRMNVHLAERMSSGARQTGHTYVIACRVKDSAIERQQVEIPSTSEALLRQIPWHDESFLVVLPDVSGALLVTDRGYSLIAGRDEFLRHAVPEGIDQAIIDFKRYAKRVGRSHPALAEVSAEFQPRQTAWASWSDVAPGSATAEQLSLMDSFTAGDISTEDFARSWLAARRQALELRERLREPFSRLLDQVFYALDDYVIDPELRDADDMTNEQLQAIVQDQLTALNSLEHGLPSSSEGGTSA